MNKKKQKKANILSIKSISVSANGVSIVKNISLTVKSGELHVVMGPNGSGKSTFLNALMGNPKYKIDSGIAMLNSASLLNLSPDMRAKKGLFLGFQYPVEIPGATLGSVLRTAKNAIEKSTHPHAPTLAPVEFSRELKKILSSLNMKESLYGHAMNEGFSGGEKKKSEIVQMLVLQPKFALLDEIDSGLDVDALRTIASAIQDAVHTCGMGVVLVTHYTRILQYLKPDKVYIFAKGKIVASGDISLALNIEAHGYESYVSAEKL